MIPKPVERPVAAGTRTEPAAPTRVAPGFLAATITLIFLAHATAYFTHEWSHATTAWLLGWDTGPFDIDYGRLVPSNILFQQQVDDGVKYAPIFAHHAGWQAALIAFDGPGIGNGLLYVVCALLLRTRAILARRWVAFFLFWLAVMAAGNVWSYAPNRTVTTHADMALVARGLGISTWLLLPVVTVPSLLILRDLFARVLPMIRMALLASGTAEDATVAVLTCMVYFLFFGHAGFDGSYGEVPADFAILSMFVLLPIAVARVLATSTRADSRPPPAFDWGN